MAASEEQREQHTEHESQGNQPGNEGRNRRRNRRRGRRPGESRPDGTDHQASASAPQADGNPSEGTDQPEQGSGENERRGRNRRRNRRGRGQETQPEAGQPLDNASNGQPESGDSPAPSGQSERQDSGVGRQNKPKQAQPNQQQKRQQENQKKERPPRGSVLNRRQTRGDYDDAPKVKEESPSYIPVVAATVDSYVSQHKGWQRDVLASLRTLIKNAAPEIEETILWSQPVFVFNGPVCFIKAYAEAVHFGFWRGTELDDTEGLLTGDLTKMRHLAIKSVKEIKPDVFESMVRQATKLNRDKGDPTLS